MIPQRKIGINYMKVILFMSIELTFATKTIHDKHLNKRHDQLHDVQPYHVLHYTVNLVVDTKSYYTHAGQVNIDIRIDSLSSPPIFYLNIQDLKINYVETRRTSDRRLFWSYYNFGGDNLEILFKDSMPPGNYTLCIDFESISTDNLFQSQLRDLDNRSLFMTQSARQLFPCWDIIYDRATFDITVIHSTNYAVLSNTKLSEQNSNYYYPTQESNIFDIRIWSKFETTPMMPADELMIVLLPTIYHSSTKFFNPIIQTWCKSNTTSTLSFAKSIINDVTLHLLQYTNGTYPISKIDHVVIWDAPEPAITKARWGIIIHRESDVIYNKEKDPFSVKMSVARKITSKVIRQWFGGLVTPGWTHSWLSMSFILFLESSIMNQMFEQWFELLFLIESLYRTMSKDDGGTDQSHSMSPVLSDEYSDYHNFSVYFKGSFLLRMLQYVMGEETFRNGVIEFLRKHKYELVTTDDLWSAMQTALNATSKPKVDIKTMMDPYVVQKSFPEVIVMRDHVTGDTIISQQPYNTFDMLHNASEIETEFISDSSKWWIPVTWATESYPIFNEPISTLWLGPENKIINIETNPAEWIIINLQQIGYYRVYYDRESWEKIGNYLNNKDYTKIHVLNRAQLIHDICDMFKKGRIEWALYSSITRYLSRETNYIAWQTMLECVTSMEMQYYFSLPWNKKRQMELASYFDGILNKIGYEEKSNDDDLTKIARFILADKACSLGNPTCRNAARNKLEKYLADPTIHQILPWWKEWTFCFGLKTLNSTVWNKVFEIYTDRKDKTILYSLPCTEDPDIIIKFLHTIIKNNTLIEKETVSDVIYRIIRQHINNDQIFYLFQNEFVSIKSLYTNDLLDDIIQNVNCDVKLSQIFIFISTKLNRHSVYTNKTEKRWRYIKAIRSKFKI